jgi:hypothetical protein
VAQGGLRGGGRCGQAGDGRDLVWSIPTLVTLNPVGAPIGHAGMHVAAILHASETETFLPPHG